MIKGIDLTVMFGPGIPAPAPAGVIEALEEVSIEENAGETQSGFSLTFAVEKDSPLNTIFLLAGGASLPIMRVALIATLNGQAIPLINGVVTHTQMSPGTQNNPGRLQVQGKDLTAALTIADFSGLPYVAMPPFARVGLILAKYAWLGIIPQVIPSLEGPPLPTDRMPRHQDTDLDYIRLLASEAGYTFFMKPGPAPATSVAYWGPDIRTGPVQPALTIDSGSPTNAEEISFGFDKEGTELPVVYIQNQQTRAPIPIPIPSAIPFFPVLGLLPPLPPNVRRLRNTARMDPVQALARGFAHAAQHSHAVTGRGRLDVLRYGHILRARALVGVRGAGLPFDGVHYVDSVTHEIKRGSYRQSFSLQRNGLLPTQASVPA